ncbi:MAG: lysine--tRNA ligase [Candidatus Gracilibacteria bacterium]|nr:lysine--tRNA ligase [Candidatus Gracilibacteria bacterium]
MANYSEETKVRLEKIKRMKELGIMPYGDKFDKTDFIVDILKSAENRDFRDVEEVIANPKIEFKTAGRIVLYRSFGKISFAKLQDSTGEIQILFSKENCSIETLDGVKSELSEEMSAFKFIEKLADVGDFIGVRGELFMTHKGELTIFAKEFKFLSKAIRPLPEKFHGLVDQETMYRQRYLELIKNNETYERFLTRSKFIKALRDFYDENGFIEIETPVLGSAASGAAAKPFLTHHNDFDEEFFLRISPETNLKKATVGRFEKVFEIGKQFRNEGSDPSHMQEFTSVEHYAVFWNFEDNMRFTEKMFDYILDVLGLEKIVKIKGKDGQLKDVNFTTPWARIDYIEGVKNACGLDVSQYFPGDEAKLRADIKAAGVEFEGMDIMATATMIDYLYKKVLRPGIIGPAFVYNYPKTMQPLARKSDKNQNIVEQFQLVINGWEVLKAYSELVDPQEQKANFDAQADASAKGDEETTASDDDFVLAMEYGMPCQSGWGMGIDRILTLLLGQDNLRDVILFPLMKSEGEKISNKEAEKLYRSKKFVFIADDSEDVGYIANALCHSALGLGHHIHDTYIKEKGFRDGDGYTHLANSLFPVTNLKANKETLIKIFKQASDEGIDVFEFGDIMKKAHTDEELREMYSNVGIAQNKPVVVGLFGETKKIEKLVEGLELFKGKN